MAQFQEDGADQSARSSNDAPEHPAAHFRSRSTAHAHSNSPKRLSVFGGRSRSNTTTSTTSSSRRSPASSMTSTDTAPVPSPEDQNRTTPTTTNSRPERHERQDSVTKSLLSRGSRMLRRQGSKFNIVTTLDEEDEGDRDKSRFEVSEIFHRHHRARQDSSDQLKRLISDPFDFHHLTHTSPSQFQSIEKTRENDLVTEFSAIRASQKPVTNLKGIHAEDIHFRDFSSEDLAGYATAATSDEAVQAAATQSPPGSPSSSSPGVSPKSDPRAARRESRIHENFSRPSSRFSKLPGLNLPASPTPEASEPAPRAIDEILGLQSQKTYPEHVYSNSDSRNFRPMPLVNLEGMFQRQGDDAPPPADAYVGAHNARESLSLSNLALDLEDVPEEEEATHWHDSSEPTSEYSASRASSRMSQPPAAGTQSRPPVYVTEELSRKFSEALASPTLPQYRLFQEESPTSSVEENARRQSPVNKKGAFETIYESWDADIDYCYDHAAESSSNFDWSRKSLEESRCPRIVEEGTGENPLPLRTIYLNDEALPTPDLDPSTTRSLPNTQAAVTPATSAGYEGELVTPADGGYFQPVSSSVFPSALGKQIPQDTLYEEYLTADAESDRHFSFGVTMHQPVSPRSSLSPISKCNSQESLILSRAASIVRKHRSSVSTASVPELVHSLASSREYMSASESFTSVSSRPDTSSHHRQTKSLETLLLLRTGSTGSFDSADVAPLASPALHDRAKSTSEVEATMSPRTAKADAPPPVPPKDKGRKKTRTTSYSLFPTTAN